MSGLLRYPAAATHTWYNRLVHRNRNRYERLMKLVAETRPTRIMEIGTWRGYHAKEIIEAALLCKPASLTYFGFDLFELADEEFIRREANADKMPPTRQEVLNLLSGVMKRGVEVKLFAGDTKQILPAMIDTLPTMDFIFIDGGHSYSTVSSDWRCCELLMSEKTVVVFDDFMNEETLKHDNYGLNRLVGEIDRSRYTVEMLKPSDWWPKPWGMMINSLVRVQLRDQDARK